MQFLKADTSATIRIGPFVDDSDGKTAETGLTLSQADVRLSKNGAAAAQKNDATSATHDEAGYYRIPLDTTDTNTEGSLDVCVSESGALPVIAKFTVLPAAVYDSLIAGSDKLEVDLVQINGTAEGSTSIRANVVAAAGTQVTGADDFKADLTSLNDPTAATIASAVWDKDISTYANAGEAGTLLKVAEANTDDLKTTTASAASIADAVWDEALSGHTSAGSAGKALADTETDADSAATGVAGLNDPSAATIASAVRSELATELARINADIDSRAAAGDAMTLTSGERTAVATALLDLANGIETGITTREALRGILSVLCGKVSGMDTNAPVFRSAIDSANRVSATTDADGNRSAVTLNLT